MFTYKFKPLDEKPIIAAKDAVTLFYTESKDTDINQLRTQILVSSQGSSAQKKALAQMTQLSILDSLAWQNLTDSENKGYNQKNLLAFAQSLTNEYMRLKKIPLPKDKENIPLQNALASATWAYIQIAAAAATAQDKKTFDLARKQMKALTDRRFYHNTSIKTIAQALRKTGTHNDMPTLALAFMYKASVEIFDPDNFKESDLMRTENLEMAFKDSHIKLGRQIAETEKHLGKFKESDKDYAEIRRKLISLKAELMLTEPVRHEADRLRTLNVDPVGQLREKVANARIASMTAA